MTLTSVLLNPLKRTLSLLSILWGFIESDFLTFALPNTAFGLFGALASSKLIIPGSTSSATPPATATAIFFHLLTRLPLVLAFNLGNLLIADLANQRSETSAVEDRINKPWRPIPSGKITSDETRRLMLAAIPVVMVLNYFLGGWEQGVCILVLNWMYNDLGGGDEAFVREVLLSAAYGMFNSGSLAVAVGPQDRLSPLGVAWVFIISGVILTTMQVQDLKDKAGDRVRRRKSICLYVGERFSRTSIAFFVCFWSYICVYFWALGPLACCFVSVAAAVVAMRVLFVRSPKGDARTWKLWCFWHASLYTLPVLIT